jgi:PDZ domain-containing protein
VPAAALAVVIALAVVVTALLPSRLVASKEVADPEHEGETIDEATPYALVPAAAQPVAERVSYGDDAEAAMGVAADTDPDGLVYFVTISEPEQSVLGWWVGANEPEVAFTTYGEKYGNQTPSQRRTAALQMMRTSGEVAQYVALTRAGYDAAVIKGPVQVAQFVCLEGTDTTCTRWVPSEDPLEVGDVIVSVDGTLVANVDELTAQLAERSPGDTVDLAVTREGEEVALDDVELTSSTADGTGRAIIGFIPNDGTDSISLPFEINIDTGQIGGPSAGLAFTLTLLDELTDGDLLGGHDVAVTGTIDLDGSVGPIGGLVQKASAVRQAGLRYFVVPAAQGAEEIEAAREVAGPDVEIIPVATVDEAIAALGRLGGDPPTTAVG